MTGAESRRLVKDGQHNFLKLTDELRPEIVVGGDGTPPVTAEEYVMYSLKECLHLFAGIRVVPRNFFRL